MENGLRSHFENKNDPLNSVQINYVWLEKASFEKDKASSKQGIPLKAVDQVINNALRYPDAQFHIWVDEAEQGFEALQRVRNHLAAAGRSNIILEDLSSINTYRDNPFFEPQADKPVAMRSDYARLIVLAHQIETTSAQSLFYADFDVKDVRLKDIQMQRILARHGMVFGAVISDKAGHYNGDFENGFMGFSRTRMSKPLFYSILETTQQIVEDYQPRSGALDDDVGFLGLLEPIEVYCEKNGLDRTDLTVRLLQPMGYKIPDNPFYRDMGVE